MSITADRFKERSGCTIFRDTAPENTNPRAPRIWHELGGKEVVTGARKGIFFSDCVTGEQVSRVDAYKRYWASTGMSKPPATSSGADTLHLADTPIAEPLARMSGTGIASALVAGAAAALLGVLAIAGRRSSKS